MRFWYCFPGAKNVQELWETGSWNGLEHSDRKAYKVMCLFLPSSRSHVLMFLCWHQSVRQQLSWNWEKLNFVNKLTSETFCLWDLLNLLDCRLRLLKHFSWIFFWKKRLYLSSSCLSNLFNTSARVFCNLSFAQSHKILS